MAGVYTPTPAKVTTYTAVADGDALDVASARVWLEALSDAIAYAQQGGESVAANWHAGGGLSFNGSRFAFGDLDGVWAACTPGGNDQLETSHTYGKAWVDQSAGKATKILIDLAFDASGNLVVITATRDVYKLTRTAYATWSYANTATALSTNASGGALDYDATAGLWLACYRNGAAGHQLDSSSNGTAWTARTLPATWTGYTGANDPWIGSRPGHSIAIFADPTTAAKVEIVYSANGTAWTGTSVTSTALSQAEMTAGSRLTRPVYDPTSATWFFALSGTTVDKAEIWASIDEGANWAIVATHTTKDVEIFSMGVLGGELVAVTSKGRIMASSDAGVTWRWVAGLAGSAGQARMRHGGGGAIVVNATDKTTRYSPRVGVDLGAVI